MEADAQPHRKTLYETGFAAYENNDHERAEALFTEAIELNPTGVGLYNCRAATREKLGDLSGALQDAQKMLEIEPCSAKGYLRAGEILKKTGKFHSVVQLYALGKTKVPETDPQYSIFLKMSARAEMELQKRTKTEFPIGTKSTVCRDMVTFLPAELVHAIFHHLDFATIWRCSGVCKSWRCFLDTSPYLWSQAMFKPASKKGISNFTIQVLIRRARFELKELDLGYASRITDAGFGKLQRSACRIERLELLQNRKVSSLALACWATMASTHLRSLCLSGSSGADDHSIGIILNTCRGLVSLDVSSCPVTDNAFGKMDMYRDYLNQNPKVLSLEELILDHCDKISSLSFAFLAESSPKLSKLSLRNATLVNNDCLLFLRNAEPPPQLRDLTLTGTMMQKGTVGFDVIFSLFARNSPGLERFELAFCPELTDVPMWHLAESSRRRLTSIDLRSSAGIPDASLFDFGRQCPNLKQVTLADCPLLTGQGLQDLIENCLGIEKFDFAGCPGVSDDACTAMGLWSDRLEQLNVSRCAVSSVGIGKLVCGAGKGLRVLLMDHCQMIAPHVANWARHNLAPGAKVSAQWDHAEAE